MKSKKTVQCLLASLAISGAATFTLNSQPANPPAQRNPDRPMPPPGGQGLFLGGFGIVANVLTEEQRASFRQAMEAEREKTREVETKLRDARAKLLEAGLDGKFDEAAVRKQAMAVAALEAENSVIRAKALSELQPPLSPEQIEKIKGAISAGPFRNGPRAGERPLQNPARRPSLTSTNRDENDLPPKQ